MGAERTEEGAMAYDARCDYRCTKLSSRRRSLGKLALVLQLLIKTTWSATQFRAGRSAVLRLIRGF